MRTVTLLQSNKLVFGNGCFNDFCDELSLKRYSKVFVITDRHVISMVIDKLNYLEKSGIGLIIDESIAREPTVADYDRLLSIARAEKVDAVTGIGGGSIMDAAKIVAAMIDNNQSIYDTFGIGKLQSRNTPLYCIPTTSGTGSEVSPNAILLDENDQLKKGIVSPFLVTDASYIDPLLTISVPPAVTAATGIDALTHCIEAYTNKYAHPVVDLYAFEGIKNIAKNIIIAYQDGENVEAREKLALGSLYGGLCLGPVNTAGVHALSYPLGGKFHIAHGISNAVLLPYVFKYNINANPERHADVALALGAEKGTTVLKTANNGVKKLFNLNEMLNIPKKISELGVPVNSIEELAEAAMKVTRLLVNNPREIKYDDALKIYKEAF